MTHSAWPREWTQPIFGDPHQHTIHSDGMGSLETALWRARHVYGHDFAAVTDHELFVGKAIGPVTWRYHRELIDANNTPGEFVTLHAYEFTGKRSPGPGHKCVYFPGEVPDELPPKDINHLHSLLRQVDAIAVPHHVGWTGADLEHHDPVLQPVWEICSTHGAYEYQGNAPITPRDDLILPGNFIQDALNAGHRFGFVGGSDNHGLAWHHGVSRKIDSLRCGLTAAFAERTREDIFNALRSRQCYATSGARILFRVDVDGAPMGSELDQSQPTLFVAVLGTSSLRAVSVVLDGKEVHRESGNGLIQFKCALKPTQSRPSHYCYVRVLQEDDEMAWSSPIWFPD